MLRDVGYKTLNGVGPRCCWTNVLDGDVLDQTLWYSVEDYNERNWTNMLSSD